MSLLHKVVRRGRLAGGAAFNALTAGLYNNPRSRRSIADALGRWYRTRGPFVTASRYLSERCFGNSAGLLNNLHGRSTLAHVGRMEIARRLAADGVAMLPMTLDVAAVGAAYLARIEDDAFSMKRGSGRYSRMLRDPAALLPSRVLTPEARRLIEDVYGGSFAITVTALYRTRHVPPDVRARYAEVYSDRWHFDWQSTAQLRMFVAISHITEADGPLMLCPIPSTREFLRRRVWRHRREHSDLIDKAAVHFTGPPGTAILCKTTLCLHRASIPEPGRIRDMLSLSFMPA